MFNSPRKSSSQQIFEALESRIQFTPEQQSAFNRLRLGYEGEKRFSELLNKQIRNHCIPLFDLSLKVDGSECQLDAILIFQNLIYHLEIKNYQGDFFFQDDQFYLASNNKEIKNPMHQLDRGRILLKNLLTERKINTPVQSYIIFVNPNFHLYQTPIGMRAIFPGQLHRFLTQLEKTTSHLGPYHQNISETLKKAHIEKSHYEQLPDYQYETLKKGVFCHKCNSPLLYHQKRKLICSLCKHMKNDELVLMENVKMFHLLFPDEPITLGTINNWCGDIISKERMQRILPKYLTPVNKGRFSYYTFNHSGNDKRLIHNG